MNQKTLQVVLGMKDQLTGGLRKAASSGATSLQRLGAGAASMASRFKAAVFSVKGLVAAVAGLVILRQAVRWTLNAAKAAMSYNTSMRVLEIQTQRVNVASEELIANLQRVTLGQISLADMATSANRAVALLGEQAIPQFVELAEVAAKASAVMGITVTKAFNDIVVGIGRQSRMILDNLGIIVNAEAAYETYAAGLGKTAEQLTEAERKQAFMNATLVQAREKFADVAAQVDPLQKLNATWMDLQVSVGQWLAQSPGVAGALEVLANLFVDLRENITDTGESTDDLAGRAFKDLVGAALWVGRGIVSLIRAFMQLAKWVKVGARAVIEFEQSIITTRNFFGIFNSEIELNRGAIMVLSEEIASLTSSMEGLDAITADLITAQNALAGANNEAGTGFNLMGGRVTDANVALSELEDTLGGVTTAFDAGASAADRFARSVIGVMEAVKRSLFISDPTKAEGLMFPVGPRGDWAGQAGRAQKWRGAEFGPTGAEGLMFPIMPSYLGGGAGVGKAAGGQRGFGLMGTWDWQQTAMATAMGGFASGGGRGAAAGLLPLIGSAFGPVGGAIGGLLGGLFGKKKRRGQTPQTPMYVSDVNVQNLLTDMLNVTKSGWALAGATGIRGIDSMIQDQIDRSLGGP